MRKNGTVKKEDKEKLKKEKRKETNQKFKGKEGRKKS